MKRVTLICICCCCFWSDFYGQKILTDIFAPATVLVQFENGASGSGVIVADTNYLYLVTARHVLVEYNKDSGKFLLNGKVAYIVCYRNNAFRDSKDSLKLELGELLKNGSIRIHASQDIAIIRVARITSHSIAADKRFSANYTYSAGITKMRPDNLDLPGVYSDLLINFSEVDPGEDAILFGYPKSLKIGGDFDYDYDRPLLRKGIIAGIDNKLQTIILDCPVYKGNSGGPAFEVSLDRKKIGLIGIVSRSILQVEFLENKYYQFSNVNFTNSGYTVIIPITFARELMR